MANLFFPMLLLLQIVVAAAISDAQHSGGLTAACKRTSDVDFCMHLLHPYADQFEDNDPNKMGYAAISAALSAAHEAQAFTVRQTTEPELCSEGRAAVMGCLKNLDASAESLRQASYEFDEMEGADEQKREVHRKNVISKIMSSIKDQKACSDSLKKNSTLTGDEILQYVGQQADEAAQAGVVAQAFIH
ncbi:hypothetical protein Salat_0800100 [Sesamum alatum]|uniref:Pectinesterase inhibitor domain-containing protein n=1 Tax=Sesamum alatum TaxID=300844 RepID=A0AAE1YTU2_9LAMI|nr:hypothetical protein Salat_0800100 [Sesamum alatum]